MGLRVDIYVVGLLSLFVLSALSLPGPCTKEPLCVHGLCVNSTDLFNHTCICNSGHIGKVCGTEYGITVSVSSQVPEKGDNVTFTSILTSPVNASVQITPPNPPNTKIENLTAFIGETKIYEITSVGYENVGEYLLDATITYEGLSASVSDIVTIDYVLTVSISASKDKLYFETGQNDATISATVATDGDFANVNVVIEKDSNLIATLTSSDETKTRSYTYEFGGAVTEANSGSYVIKATETYGGFPRPVETVISVTIEVPVTKPLINESATDDVIVFVTKGTEVRLHCEATGIPAPTVLWSYADEEISSSASESVYQTQEGLLVFTSDVTFQENGTYVCTGTNMLQNTGEKKAKTSVTIIIEGISEVDEFSPDPALQKDALVFSCVFDAYPKPTITWTWQGDEVSQNQLFVEKIEADPIKYYRIEAELRIPHSALCLGKGSVKCNAANAKGSKEKEFKINQDPYDTYKESYIIFPDEVKHFADASSACGNLNGSLVDIRSEADQSTFTGFADQFSISEFYIGLNYKTSEWRWPDNSLLQGFDKWNSPPPSPSASDCAFNKKSGSVWGWEITDCTIPKKFACEIKASKFPSNLIVVAEKCNGREAIVNWSPPGGVFDQLIEMQPASGIPGPSSLLSNASSMGYSDLSFNTEYTVKVSSGLSICILQPYAETTFKTAYQKAATPTVTVNDTSCDISWIYPSSRTAEIDGYKVVITEEVADQTNGETVKTIKDETITANNYKFTKVPNSLYRISVQGISCIENSDTAEKTCITSPEAMTPPTIDSFPVATDTANGITIQLSKYSDRNGIIGCVYLIARWTTSRTNFDKFTIDSTIFEAIAQETEDVTDGTDYFAFAMNNEEQNVTLGVGGDTTQCPTTSTTNRKKRATVPSNTIKAYNRPLQADANYRLYVILAVEQNGNLLLANGAWSDPIRVSQAPTSTPIAAIVVPVILVILLIVAIVLYLVVRKRQERKKESEQPPAHQIPQTRNAHINQAFSENVYESVRKDTAIAVENLRSTYLTKHADEDRLFREEYRALATEVSELDVHYNYAMAAELREKNRFSNIYPANESRVVLRREGNDIYSDYINASYLDGYRHPRKFIASQGPLQNTIGDFWYMVWEQESTVIVMLTRVDEGGRRKCEKYWPDDHQECLFDNLLVKSVSTVEFGPISQRTFQLSNPSQSQKKVFVEQFHYVTWPDHGVPSTTSALFNLRRLVIESQGNNPSPIVVHCSAGVGRTGTFIAMDCLINQMAREGKVDVEGAVFDMRRKRKEMVQTVDQYAFLHKLMLENYLFGVTDRKTAEFSDLHKYKMLLSKVAMDRDLFIRIRVSLKNGAASASFEEMVSVSASKSAPIRMMYRNDANRGLRAQYETMDDKDSFDNLSKVPPFTNDCQLPEGAEDKIRNRQILPYQHCKVIIRMRPSEEKSRFINASFVQTYSSSEAFIACQGPVESGIEDFWRVVLDHNVSAIVMLSELRENGEEHCSQYWPEDSESPRVFGDITVALQSQTEGLGFTERWMQVSEKVLHLRRSLSVMQLQYKNWPNGSVPSDPGNILNMMARSQASRKTGQGKAPVLVHCRDGSGRTGTFCAIVNLIERLKNEDRVDVFRTVKDLRDMRPLMVCSLEQYRFCVQAVKDYLDSFQLYANFN